MKLVKRILIGLAIFVVLVVAAAIILPIVFKDDIKAAIDREIAKNVNADVVFDVNNFDLTLFSNFPNMTVRVKELGVFNREPFAGVPLFVMQQLEVEVNLKDLIFGDQIRVKGISLVEPQITIKVLPDGRANYDITYPSTDTVTVAAEEPTAFQFGIDHWEIVNGYVEYDDQSLPYFLQLKGLNHEGRGDFSEAIFDLRTKTRVDTVTTSFDGMELLTNKRVSMDAVIEISEEYTKYTFKENEARVNDFGLRFDGWFKMNENDFGMDLTFGTPETSFKTLLSLVPGVYTKDFGAIKTSGDLAFAGFVKGTYSDTQMPAFNVDLKVKEGMFQYPDLPTAVRNINLDLLIDNKTGVIEETVVNLKNMHLDFGSNPVDARLLIQNLKDYRMDATLAAKLNLAELMTMFPMDGLELKGQFAVNAKANGVYDSIRKIIPALDMNLALTDGYAKSKEFPLPLEQMGVLATVKNTSGKMAETVVEVKDFSMLLDNEKFNASLILQNLDDYTWDLKAKGGVDLEKMTKIFPLDGMTVAGLVKADVETKGKMSDVTAERYDRLPTSGSASLTNFAFAMKDLPYQVTVSQAQAVFDPKKIELRNTVGTIGKSDFTVSGAVMNYIGYVFGPNETIKGNLDYQSNLLDLNEFMTDTEEATTTEDTAALTVIPIPRNIDFVLRSSIKTVKMMDYVMTNAAGDVVLRDGVANMSGLRFNLLGGSFVLNGSYTANDIQHPKYDFDMKIDALSIQQAASSFSVIKTYAPIAGLVNGNFGTDFKIRGELKQDMMPNLATVSGAGLIKIAQAALSQSKLVSGVTAITKLNDTDQVTLKDVIMSATIENGKLSVKPFDVKFGRYTTNVSGSTNLDGTIDYVLKMNVPAGALGAQYQGLLASITGNANANPNQDIPISIGIGGTYNNPQSKLLMTEQRQQVQEAKAVVKEEVKAATEEVKQSVTQAAEEKKDQVIKELTEGQKPKDVLNNLLKPDSSKRDSTKQKPAEQLQNKLNNLLRKKKNN
jgi:hypothetical protein